MYAAPTMYTSPGVGLLLQQPDNSVLMVHRDNLPHIRSPNKWSIPTGRVEAYDRGTSLRDTMERAVRREAAEELSIVTEEGDQPLTLPHLTLVYNGMLWDPDRNDCQRSFVFKAEFQHQFDALVLHEGQGMQFVNPADVFDLDLNPAYRPILEQILER